MLSRRAHTPSNATDIRYKMWLRTLARDVNTELNTREVGGYRSIQLKVEASRLTSGWYCDIGDLGMEEVDGVSLYVDTITRAPQPKLFAGVFVVGEARARRIGKAVAPHLGRAIFIPSSKLIVEDDVSYFKMPLASQDFDTLVVETYDAGGAGMGDIGHYYKEALNPDAVPPRRLVRLVASRLSELIVAVEDAFVKPSPRSVVNKRAVVSSKVWKRSPTQARAVKQRDNWQCQVCDTRPRDVYGATGDACLEAHHIQALHAQRGVRRTRLEDLVTVCANCHRILNHLSPDERGLSQLRRRFASARKVGRAQPARAKRPV